MRMRQLGAFVAMTLLWSVAANAQIVPVALDNDPAPGTPGDYSFLGVPSLNDSGEVAFVSTLSGGGPIVGVFVESDTGGTAVAFRGDPAPGSGGGTFLNFGGVTVNANGDVAFQSTLSGGTAGSGLFVWSGGTITTVVLAGDTAPGTGGGTITAPSFPGFNDAGTLAFSSLVAGGIVGEGVFRVTGGVITPVAVTADPVPGVAGAFFTDFQAPALGEGGEIAFHAEYFSGARDGIYVDQAGVLSAVANFGDPAPGTGGSTYSNFSPFTPSVSPTGAVLFGSGFIGGAQTGFGLFRDDGPTQSPIVFTGDAVPGVAGSLFTGFSNIGVVNAAGKVAFQGSLSVPAGGSGIFTNEGGTLSAVAVTGDAVPVSGGSFNSFGIRPAINTDGDVAFSGVANFGTASTGVWLLPEPAGAVPILLCAGWLFRLARTRSSASPTRR